MTKELAEVIIKFSEQASGRISFPLLVLVWEGVKDVEGIDAKVGLLKKYLPLHVLKILCENAKVLFEGEEEPPVGYFYKVPEGKVPEDVMIPREFVLRLSEMNSSN